MSHLKKLLGLFFLLLSAVWLCLSLRDAIFVFFLVCFAFAAFALTKTACFYFVSECTYAKVVHVRFIDRPDMDGYRNRTYFMTFQYTVGNREYTSKEFADLIELFVGDIVKIRYRRADPHDMQYDYWGILWWMAIILAALVGGICATMDLH